MSISNSSLNKINMWKNYNTVKYGRAFKSSLKAYTVSNMDLKYQK